MELRTFLFSQAIVSAAVLLADVCSFVFYGLALRFTPAQFAEVTSLTALNFILTVCSAMLGTFILMRTKDRNAFSEAFTEGARLATTLGIAVMLLFVASSPLLRYFLHFTSALPFIILGCVALPGMQIAALQSQQTALRHFFRLAVGIVLLGALRIPAGYLLFSDGYGVLDAPLSILFASVGTFVALLLMNGNRVSWRGLVPLLPSRETVYSLVQLLWSLFIVGALLKMDILWSKHALDAEAAGVYGMTSLVASVLYYMTMGVSRPAMSYISERTVGKIAGYSIAAIGAVCILAMGGYALIGRHLFASIATHADDMSIAPLILLFVAMTGYSMLNFSVQCLGVLHRTVHVRIMSVVVLADAALLVAFGRSTEWIAAIQAFVLCSAAIVAIGFLFFRGRRRFASPMRSAA